MCVDIILYQGMAMDVQSQIRIRQAAFPTELYVCTATRALYHAI